MEDTQNVTHTVAKSTTFADVMLACLHVVTGSTYIAAPSIFLISSSEESQKMASTTIWLLFVMFTQCSFEHYRPWRAIEEVKDIFNEWGEEEEAPAPEPVSEEEEAPPEDWDAEVALDPEPLFEMPSGTGHIWDFL